LPLSVSIASHAAYKGRLDKRFLPQGNMGGGDFLRVRRYKRYIGFGMAGALPAVDY
jgi:hypothetical protein